MNSYKIIIYEINKDELEFIARLCLGKIKIVHFMLNVNIY